VRGLRLLGEQEVPVDDGGGEVDELAIVDSRALAQHLEGGGLVDGVAFHQDALGALGQGAPSERAFELVVFGEAAQRDVDRALPVVDVGIADVREDPALGRLADEVGIARVQENDHGAGGLPHDLVDQIECVVRALSEADQRDVRSLAGGHGTHVLDVDLPCDHLMSERDHERGDEREAILALVGDQDAQVVGLAVAHQPLQRGRV
jgi:hypothetical protein